MRPTPTLMLITELGGYPDFSPDFAAAGFEVKKAPSMRQAIKLLKSAKPDVVISEFNFGPTYGDRISNLEPLLAQLQAGHAHTKLILFAERDRMPHLDRLRSRFPIYDVFWFPIEQARLRERLQQLAIELSVATD